ncbi:MAG TPA: hypothetical protein VLH56_05070 [Dissulfurispiraceae bacterium]|nr:hypothetical protein [Dissulfurispiraceae bacterium]
MLLTEDEARSKKCILLFKAVLSNSSLVDPSGRMNRHTWDGCKCIGSSCLTGWRWAEPEGERRRGYCGIGQRPEF